MGIVKIPRHSMLELPSESSGGINALAAPALATRMADGSSEGSETQMGVLILGDLFVGADAMWPPSVACVGSGQNLRQILRQILPADRGAAYLRVE